MQKLSEYIKCGHGLARRAVIYIIGSVSFLPFPVALLIFSSISGVVFFASCICIILVKLYSCKL